MKYVIFMTLWILALLILVSESYAQPERYYQEKYCTGQLEYVLSDRTRVDCLTETVAWEYDFAKKWAEAIGQSLHYGAMTNRQPGIALIVKSLADLRYVNRLLSTIHAHGLDINVVLIEGEL